jgi:hypothetical protein
MRSLTLICLISILSLSIQASVVGQSARDFLTGVFTTIKGIDFKLNDQCFGSDFEEDYTRLIAAINKENAILAGAIGQKIAQDAAENCPTNEIKQVVSDVEALVKSGKIQDNVLSHTKDIIHTFKEEISQPQITPTNLGQTLGSLVNTIVYSRSHNLLSFLEDLGPDTFALDLYEKILNLSSKAIGDFVDGFFEGVSSVPYAENKCKTDITADKSEIIDAFSHLIEAIKTRKNVMDALKGLYDLALSLKSLSANCHFAELSVDIAALSSYVGISKLVYRVTTNLPSLIGYVKDAYSGFSSGDLRKAGVGFGAITRVSLNYSTQ